MILTFSKSSFILYSTTSTYNPICAPADVSFKLEAGENILIVGENGFGKSSLLRVISGLWKAQEGTLHNRPSLQLRKALTVGMS